MCRQASSGEVAGQRHDLVGGEAARGRTSHPLETARLYCVLSNSTQKGATVFRHLEINLAASFDPKAIADLLWDRTCPLRVTVTVIPPPCNTTMASGITSTAKVYLPVRRLDFAIMLPLPLQTFRVSFFEQLLYSAHQRPVICGRPYSKMIAAREVIADESGFLTLGQPECAPPCQPPRKKAKEEGTGRGLAEAHYEPFNPGCFDVVHSSQRGIARPAHATTFDLPLDGSISIIDNAGSSGPVAIEVQAVESFCSPVFNQQNPQTTVGVYQWLSSFSVFDQSGAQVSEPVLSPIGTALTGYGQNCSVMPYCPQPSGPSSETVLSGTLFVSGDSTLDISTIISGLNIVSENLGTAADAARWLFDQPAVS